MIETQMLRLPISTIEQLRQLAEARETSMSKVAQALIAAAHAEIVPAPAEVTATETAGALQ